MSTLFSCVLFYSFLNGIDYRITNAVIKVESNGNPYALGTQNDHGLMQIKSQYVKESKMQLFQSCTNVKVGVELLKKAKDSCKKCSNDELTWIVAYNTGITGAKAIKHKKSFPYYIKVTEAMQ